jgi:hypothetical protein
VARTIVETLCCWFRRRTGKAMLQLYECWWRICQEINYLQVRISHILSYISICDLFTDSRSYVTLTK